VRRLERGEVPADARGDVPAPRRQRHDERAAIGLADRPRHERAFGKPIEDARQGRPFVRQPFVQLADGGGRRVRQQGEDVRLALREAILTQVGQIEADPVRRAVDRWNEPERHR
jgi:hypothetical protein